MAKFLPCLLLAFAALWSAVNAIMAIDFGKESIKMAIIVSGQFRDIVLNEESKRKSPAEVAFELDGVRKYGLRASSHGLKKPFYSFRDLKPLIGKSTDSEAFKDYLNQHSIYKWEKNEETGLIEFEVPLKDHKDNIATKYTVVELVAMMFQNSKRLAEASASSTLNDVAITVPPFYNNKEREEIRAAAQMAGFKNIYLVNDGMATAMDYATRQEFDTPETHLFLDIGAGSASITPCTFQLVNETESNGKSSTFKKIECLIPVSDETLKGDVTEEVLRDHLIKEAKSTRDLRADPVAMRRLWTEARNSKHILTANNEASVHIEDILDDKVFKTQITRDAFNNMIRPHIEGPLKSLLSRSLEVNSLPKSSIKSIVLAGGATRLPLVQEILKSEFKPEIISKLIDADESACLGALFQGIRLSRRHRAIRMDDFESIGRDIVLSTSENDAIVLFNQRNTTDSSTSITLNITQPNLKVTSFSEIDNSITEFEVTLDETVDTPATLDFYYTKSGFLALRNVTTINEPSLLDALGSKIKGVFGDGGAASSKQPSDTETVETIETPSNASTPSKAPLKFDLKEVKSANLFREILIKSRAKLSELKQMEREVEETERARTDLESMIYSVKDDIESFEEFIEHSTEAERSELEKIALAAQDWIYGEGTTAAIGQLNEKMKELSSLHSVVLNRMRQRELLPDTLTKFNETQEILKNTLALLSQTVTGLSDSDSEAVAKISKDMKEFVAKAIQQLTNVTTKLDEKRKIQELSKPFEDVILKNEDVQKAQTQLTNLTKKAFNFMKKLNKAQEEAKSASKAQITISKTEESTTTTTTTPTTNDQSDPSKVSEDHDEL